MVLKKSFWLINTARGTSVVTKDLVTALKSGKILGAGLDVLEYEKSSFENLFKKRCHIERSRDARCFSIFNQFRKCNPVSACCWLDHRK